MRGTSASRIRIVSQAPGTRAHGKDTPFMDPSGVRLRDWLGMSETEFYDEDIVAITPMGFCFPGLDAKGGDRPPRKECAPLWQHRADAALSNVTLTLLIGAYAQRWHLKDRAARTLTETVSQWRNYWPEYAALPHPSWRNNAWLKRNPWFENDVLPELRARIRSILEGRV
ncbi:MAG: uracil-DNA glycosylase family protein [Oceanicaulis sp.]